MLFPVYPRLFVGNEQDCKPTDDTWSVVHACKDPCHRAALGYTTRSAPKDDPEYLCAIRDNNLVLNLIDGLDSAFIPDALIQTALEFMQAAYSKEKKVLVHCNQAVSRSPGIAMLFLRTQPLVLPEDFEQALAAFKELYPPFAPSGGILGYLKKVW